MGGCGGQTAGRAAGARGRSSGNVSLSAKKRRWHMWLETEEKYDTVKEAPKSMLVAMGIIASIILFIGLFPDIFINNIVEPAANALVNSGEYIQYIMGVI